MTRWLVPLKRWEQVRQVIPAEYFLELSQSDLSQNPDSVAKQVGGLVGLTAGQQRGARDFLGRHRPESTGATDDTTALRIEDLNWSAGEKAFFFSRCFDRAVGLGYIVSRKQKAASTVPTTR